MRALTHRSAPTILLVLLALFCASGVFDHSLWTPNDSREGGMVAEMYRTGRWSVLSLNGEAFLEKPPLLHWVALSACTLTGRITAGIVRIPAVVFGFMTALLVWSWGRRLGRELGGVVAASLCVTNITYYEYSRIVLTDIGLTFAVALALDAFWRAYDATRARAERYAIFLIVAALSFYAKGLVAPVFVMASVVVFLGLQRRWRLALGLSLAFMPILLIAIAPWALALYRAGGSEYLIGAFVDNQLGRFFKLPTGTAITALPLVGRFLGFMADRPIPYDPYFVHKEPLYHYLVKLPVRLLPWTLLVVPALHHWFRKRSPVGGSFSKLLSCFLVIALVILHAASSKAGHYALPLFPVLFLMIGIWCEDVTGAALPRFGSAMVRATSWIVGVTVIVLPGAYLFFFLAPAGLASSLRLPASWGDPAAMLRLPGPIVAGAGALLCLMTLPLAIWSLRIVRARFAGHDHASGLLGLAATWALVVMLAGTAWMPAYDRQRSYVPVTDMANAQLALGHPVALATHDAQLVGELVFYTGRTIPLIDPGPGIRSFLESAPGASVVARRSDLPAILPALGTDYEIVSPAADAGVNAKELCLIVPKRPA